MQTIFGVASCLGLKKAGEAPSLQSDVCTFDHAKSVFLIFLEIKAVAQNFAKQWTCHTVPWQYPEFVYCRYGLGVIKRGIFRNKLNEVKTLVKSMTSIFPLSDMS
jgi:hypothetical protein